MIFAAIKAGKYVILENDTVTATITKKLRPFGRWYRTEYEVKWKGYPERDTVYRTLADIHDHLQFKNYAGYGKVLLRR